MLTMLVGRWVDGCLDDLRVKLVVLIEQLNTQAIEVTQTFTVGVKATIAICF